MPCNSITTQSINLSNADQSVLVDGLRADGWEVILDEPGHVKFYKYGVSVTWHKGQGLTLDAMSQRQTDEALKGVTRAYSRQAVSWAAKKAGWQTKQVAQNKFTVTRRF